MKPTLLLLAAGMGSRYGGLKQLDGVGPNDEPILEYSVFDAIRAGFGKVVFVIRPDFADDFKAKVTSKFADKIEIDYVFQALDMVPDNFAVPAHRQKPWGTGHAILVAESAIHEPFVALNADDFYGAGSYQVLADHLSAITDLAAVDYAMVGYLLRNTLSDHGTVSRGLCQAKGDYLQSIVELTKIEKAGNGAVYYDEAGQAHPLTGDEIISLNIWGFTPAVFSQLRTQFSQFLAEKGHTEKEEFFIPNEVGHLIDSQQATVKILPSRDPWFGVTYREDKPYVMAQVKALIDQGIYPYHLWS